MKHTPDSEPSLSDHQFRRVFAKIVGIARWHGKGIVLVHDFQRATAEAAMDLFRGADLRVRRAFASDQAGHAQNPAFNLRNRTLPRR
jgi:hypothetical protein